MTKLAFKSAFLAGAWAENVSIAVDEAGVITSIEDNVDGITGNLCAVPGMANLHSHAHQRAMTGLAEQASRGRDSFWTWRNTMYQFVQRIEPHHLQSICAQLYMEMLKAGYTRVAEFQYLHHQCDGDQYREIAEMSLQVLSAATHVGIGLTNLPVFYQYGGFGEQTLSKQQRRFGNQADAFLEIVASLRDASKLDQNIVTGVAAHSIRAVSLESLKCLLSDLPESHSMPIHIHIAEQEKEVSDCLQFSQRRPVEYLMDHFELNSNWCLVHATHMSEEETTRLAKSGAVVGLCPSTEANLGDGFFNAKAYLDAGGRFGIGSDSHISISPCEELRWLEYGQRLKFGTRNHLADGELANSELARCELASTGRRLMMGAASGGALACGHNSGSIEVGKQADIVVLDTNHPMLCERSKDEILDSWIFSGNGNPIQDVYVAGQKMICAGSHVFEEQIEQQFRRTMNELRNRNN